MRRDFSALIQKSNILLANLRSSTPDTSFPATPTISRRPSAQVVIQQEQQQQRYWNEYDDGSEVEENEPYTIYVRPGADTSFPGSNAFNHLISSVKVPMEKFKDWLSPTASPGEQRGLLRSGNGNGLTNSNDYFIETDVDGDDEAYASSSDFPTGYATHYATFPSVRDQRSLQSRNKLLFYGQIVSFVAALVLFLVASLLVATGKHKLRVEVDLGATIGTISSVVFLTLGLVLMMYQRETLGWLHQSIVVVVFTGLCILNLMLLVLVLENSVS